jgi:hypothetical protein
VGKIGSIWYMAVWSGGTLGKWGLRHVNFSWGKGLPGGRLNTGRSLVEVYAAICRPSRRKIA